jgi:hypothetical protein
MKRVFKLMTFILSMFWIMGLCLYSAALIGTLAHELTHKSFALNATAIEVHYDGTGITHSKTGFLTHNHELAYMNGYVVETALTTISVFALLIIILYSIDASRTNIYIKK